MFKPNWPNSARGTSSQTCKRVRFFSCFVLRPAPSMHYRGFVLISHARSLQPMTKQRTHVWHNCSSCDTPSYHPPPQDAQSFHSDKEWLASEVHAHAAAAYTGHPGKTQPLYCNAKHPKCSACFHSGVTLHPVCPSTPAHPRARKYLPQLATHRVHHDGSNFGSNFPSHSRLPVRPLRRTSLHHHANQPRACVSTMPLPRSFASSPSAAPPLFPGQMQLPPAPRNTEQLALDQGTLRQRALGMERAAHMP